ncbi:MAG TPA: 8-oxo-dGTP diphosphatase MutT [Pasteurellaceae bacterium]|nr:8-oxo-dGTP diphosphatase MutT [Pasteurellaceae bacterium]
MTKKFVQVAVGIIRNKFNQIYLTQRLESQDFACALEFPGGKINRDETPEQALKRELEEEIGIHVQDMIIYDQFLFEYPEKMIHFYFYLIEEWLGEPFGREGQNGFWLSQNKLDANQFPPANLKLIQRLLAEADVS